MAATNEQWVKWSFDHNLPKDVVHIECQVVHLIGKRDYLLLCFVKKSRGGAAAKSTRQYDFSVILDIHLVIENSFGQLVLTHREQAFKAADGGGTKVCSGSNHDCVISHGAAG
jgi:hypothetical protein